VIEKFETKSMNILKGIDSIHVINEKKGIDHWVIITEYSNEGDLEKYLNLKSGINMMNRIPPNPPLSEYLIGNYFGQIRLFCFYFYFIALISFILFY
jgi:hypothetical protein